jgi:hypothetical protein
MHAVERPAGDESLPFSVRMLSFENLLAPPIDHYCPTVVNALDNEGQAEEVRVAYGNVSAGVQFTVGDRFNGHKVSFKRTERPVCASYVCDSCAVS